MKRLFLSLSLVAALVIPAAAAPVAQPVPAPAWTLTDLSGNPVKSDQFKGKVVVVDFWATWCPPCRAEIPGYVKLQKKYADKGVVFVGISMDTAGTKLVKAYVEKTGIPYPIVMGDPETFAAFGGQEAIPMTVLIDRDGTIRDRDVGAVSTDEYEKTLLKYLQ